MFCGRARAGQSERPAKTSACRSTLVGSKNSSAKNNVNRKMTWKMTNSFSCSQSQAILKTLDFLSKVFIKVLINKTANCINEKLYHCYVFLQILRVNIKTVLT
jgi:hypothetical protein